MDARVKPAHDAEGVARRHPFPVIPVPAGVYHRAALRADPLAGTGSPAGIQCVFRKSWVPACAGTTAKDQSPGATLRLFCGLPPTAAVVIAFPHRDMLQLPSRISAPKSGQRIGLTGGSGHEPIANHQIIERSTLARRQFSPGAGGRAARRIHCTDDRAVRPGRQGHGQRL